VIAGRILAISIASGLLALIDALPAAAAHVERINSARRRASSDTSGELVPNDEV
jgi:hypothetical protein